MITERIDHSEFISIDPPRIADAESRMSLDHLRARFAHDEGLPFAHVLTEAPIRDALDEHGVRSMPDTPENRAAYPQPVVQQPGISFPMARVGVLLSLATGACRDLAIAPYAGKGTGETTLLRRMYDVLSPGDVVLADALFDNYYPRLRAARARHRAGRAGAGGAGREPDGGGPDRWRRHPLAAAQQAREVDSALWSAAGVRAVAFPPRMREGSMASARRGVGLSADLRTYRLPAGRASVESGWMPCLFRSGCRRARPAGRCRPQ